HGPRRLLSTAQVGCSRALQADVGGAAPPPNTRAGVEGGWLGFDEHLLFNGREFDHGPAILRVAEGGEDLSGDAKIRMVHVGAFLRFGEAQGQVAKVVGGHERVTSVWKMGTIAWLARNGMTHSKIKSQFQGAVEFEEFGSREGADVICEIRFSQTYEIVAHNPARML